MGKRIRLDEPSDTTQRSAKKHKHDTSKRDGPAEEIVSARQLQSLLVFEQDQAQSLKSINGFRAFLTSILHPDNEDDVPRRRAILGEYLESQRPREVEGETEYLPGLMQSWNFAASSNSDTLLSAIASAIDQLLKILSTRLELREHGLALCRTLLQQAQLRILSRGVASQKHKEHILGPCLRILKEIVSFDGGVLARQLYAKRDLAFDPQAIAKCLTYRRSDATEPEDIVLKPTVRTTAIRYVLANLKFQDDGAKADMLKQGSMMRVLVDGIESDHPRIISDILQSFTRDVIQDHAIALRNKSFLFNDRNLLSLSQLYRTTFNEQYDESTGRKPLAEEIHEFMLLACTSPDAGVMRASGWYPPINDEEAPNAQLGAETSIDLGLNAIDWYNKFSKHVPIRNQTLGEFILNLRPYAYDTERELLLAIFEAAPEMVAWFYRRMAQNFPFTPKLTATWIGYAAALFSSVQLPVPPLYSRMSHVPPPVSIMIENVLPAPLDQKTLRQCLVSKSDLVRLFSIRILVASLQKLQSVLSVLKQKADASGRLWVEASAKLTEEFCRRCPTLQDITKLYGTMRNASVEKKLQREATLRLLALYHEVLPQVALEENFDVSIPLTNALQSVEQTASEDEEEQLRLLELNHLVKIARWSSSVHWLGKTKGLNFSPLTTLLRLLARSTPQAVRDIKELVKDILRDGDAIQIDSGNAEPSNWKPSALDALIVSFKSIAKKDDASSLDPVYTFLDNCFHRFSARPIKYEDDRDALLGKHGAQKPQAKSKDVADSSRSSLICLVIMEQWQFVKDEKPQIARWILHFLHLLSLTKDPLGLLLNNNKSQVIADLRKDNFELHASQKAEIETMLHDYVAAEQDQALVVFDEMQIEQTTIEAASARPVFDMSTLAPAPDSENHPVLSRYRKKDLTTLIDDGEISALIQCLGTAHLSIRMQAITALHSVMTSLLSSSHLDKDMLYLLIGELLETCTDNSIEEKPLAGIAVAFATKAVDVLKDPTHALYVKMNEFLNKRPVWRVRAMCVHWLEQVLLHPPGDPDTEGAYWREVVWVLEWLFDALKTNDDFDVLRRNGLFEKLMALFFHPAMDKRRFIEQVVSDEALTREASLQAKIRPLILRIVARASLLGGATVLVTGAGVLAWLKDIRTLVAGDQRAVKLVGDIEAQVVQLADKDKIEDWSGGMLSKE